MKKKFYCLDTNVILHSADAIFKFEEHTVVIPITVIEELDNFKREKGELGHNARAFSRHIDKLRKLGNLINGVTINDKGGMLLISMFSALMVNNMSYLDMTIPDNRILATAAFYQSEEVNSVLVSNDTNLRIKADLYAVRSEDYRHDKSRIDENYTGIVHIDVEQSLIDRVYAQQSLNINFIPEVEPSPNECFVLHSNQNTKQSALVRYDFVMKEYKLLPQNLKCSDILPRNSEQCFAIDMLKDPTLDLVSIIGLAGSGKTICACAAAIRGVLETNEYSKILLLKPIMSMDNSNDLGYLPGSMSEKLAPWMASYMDNISIIMEGMIKEEPMAKKSKKTKNMKALEDEFEKSSGKISPAEELIALGLLEIGSLEHLRGRSLSKQFIIIDEAQNCSINAIKTIITRVAEGSKIVLLGDVSQIDNPYLDSKSNGLSVVVEKFRPIDFAGHISFTKSERSRLAEVAANIL